MLGTRLLRYLLCLGLAGLASASCAVAQLGADPFFPGSGDARYDVSSYDVRLAFQPGSSELRSTVAIEATPLQPLNRFSLDLDGLRVTGVAVNGHKATFTRTRGKLDVVPDVPLAAGEPFIAVVHYRGRPRPIVEPGGLVDGWFTTRDGALAVGESVGTASWLPCNNRLSDKATFDFHLTVPDDLKAVANGRLIQVTRRGPRRTFHWRESQPMDAYLAMIDIGQGKLVRSEINGIPAWTMVDPRLAKRWKRPLATLPDILRFESRIFGPYPFDATGSVIDRAGFEDALESQTRPVYDLPPSRSVIVHEMAHQWFGDSVGLQRWPDIWLNEGFATWTEWYYEEQHGGPSALRTFRLFRHTPAFVTELWNPPPGRPGKPRHLFDPSIYLRGAMALEALRIKIGTSAMLEVLHDWLAGHTYGSANTNQFIALAEQVSGRDLGPLFHHWLFEPSKP